MIKILHTSDWHLGKIIYGKSMLEDQQAFLYDFFIPLLNEQQPDAVIISGDIYDRKVAPSAAIRLFDDILTKIRMESNTRIILISGNHDGGDRLLVGSRLLSQLGVHIVSRLDENVEPVTISSGDDTVDIWPVPYVEPADVRLWCGDESIHSFEQAYARLCDSIKANMTDGHINILSAHCFVSGAQISQSESPVYIGGSGEIGSKLFDIFDYAALGHLHAPQKIGKCAYYSGSPLKYSFDEQHHSKGINLITIDSGNLSVSTIPYKPVRDMRVLTGTFDELRQAGISNSSEDYIFISLTDEVPIYEPVARLREYYPNILGLESQWMYHNSEDSGRDLLRRDIINKDSSDSEIFTQFLRQICSIEPDEQALNLFKEICAADD